MRDGRRRNVDPPGHAKALQSMFGRAGIVGTSPSLQGAQRRSLDPLRGPSTRQVASSLRSSQRPGGGRRVGSQRNCSSNEAPASHQRLVSRYLGLRRLRRDPPAAQARFSARRPPITGACAQRRKGPASAPAPCHGRRMGWAEGRPEDSLQPAVHDVSFCATCATTSVVGGRPSPAVTRSARASRAAFGAGAQPQSAAGFGPSRARSAGLLPLMMARINSSSGGPKVQSGGSPP